MITSDALMSKYNGYRKKAKKEETILKYDKRISLLKELSDKGINSFDNEEHFLDYLTNPMTTDDNRTTEVNNEKLDIFEEIEKFTITLVYSDKTNSYIITGMPGVGKTTTVEDTLDSITNLRYKSISGSITEAGLYETLFANRDKLIVFDDCDHVFKDAKMVSYLKAALDTKKKRVISKVARGTQYYNPDGLTDFELQQIYDADGSLPTSFEFKGKIIFISNLDESKFDSALISRNLQSNVALNHDELKQRLLFILNKMNPEMDMSVKEDTLEYVFYVYSKYRTKHPLDARKLIHCLSIRKQYETVLHNDGTYLWKKLVNGFLTK